MEQKPVANAGWSITLRVVVSGLLVFHVLAVFVPPFTFATTSGPGTGSPFAEPLMRALKPYTDVVYLDHGYFFFAPNPGPSHLLRAKLEFADGRPTKELMFPDRSQHWPRLLYHRHFMLAEQLHSDFVPPQPPPGIDPVGMVRWQRARDIYVQRRQSFADHLRMRYGAANVTLTRVEHELMPPGEYASRADQINAAETFVDLPEDLSGIEGQTRIDSRESRVENQRSVEGPGSSVEGQKNAGGRQ